MHQPEWLRAHRLRRSKQLSWECTANRRRFPEILARINTKLARHPAVLSSSACTVSDEPYWKAAPWFCTCFFKSTHVALRREHHACDQGRVSWVSRIMDWSQWYQNPGAGDRPQTCSIFRQPPTSKDVGIQMVGEGAYEMSKTKNTWRARH